MVKNLKIFGEALIDPKAIQQMHEAMACGFAVQGALMPDAHLGKVYLCKKYWPTLQLHL